MLKRIQLECRGRSPEEITELNLDNCRSTGEPEGLTDEFRGLKKLSMVKAGLTTLKGFPNLPNLLRIDISGNRISGSLSCLKGCTAITHLNLSDNKIKSEEVLEPLAEMSSLTSLDLSYCEVSKIPKYRETIFQLIPSLKSLDGYDVNDQELADSEDEEEDENGEINNSDGLDVEDDDEDDEDAEPSNVEEVSRNSKEVDGLEDADDEEDIEESDADSDDEQEYGLAYLDGADIIDEDSDDDEDYEGGEEQADEDIDEEDDDGDGDAPRGVKRKHADEEEPGE